MSAFYLTSPATAPENSLMSTHASFPVDSVGPPSAEVCRTAASFPLSGSPKVYRTQGGSGQRYPLSSNPAIEIQEVSCVPDTPNTLVRCIGALVRRRDSIIQVV